MMSQSSFQANINVNIKIDAEFEIEAIFILNKNALRFSVNLFGVFPSNRTIYCGQALFPIYIKPISWYCFSDSFLTNKTVWC